MNRWTNWQALQKFSGRWCPAILHGCKQKELIWHKKKLSGCKMFLILGYKTQLKLKRKSIYHKLNTNEIIWKTEDHMVMSSIKPQHSAEAEWDEALPGNLKARHRLFLGSYCSVFGRALARLSFTVITAHSGWQHAATATNLSNWKPSLWEYNPL